MATDYGRISRENLEEYGRNLKGWRRPLLAERYADRMHFMLELLQNAEDALGRRGDDAWPRGVRFELAGGAVRFRHYGQPFNTKDVEGVCGIGETTKADDLTAIGHFGIGFKSVYAVTDRPEVHSGGEHFAIENDVCPVAVPPIDPEQGETIIVLPLREGDEAAIGAAFGRLGPRTLLFLRHITAIEWTVEGGRSGYYRRYDSETDGGARRVTLLAQTHGEGESEETWLVLSRDVRQDGSPAGRVEVAFKIAADESGGEAVEVIRDSRFAAFFPTEIDAPLGMLIQGPYRTTSSRENIPPADEWNRYLVGETAGLLVEALRYLRDHGLLGVHVYEALPLERPQADVDIRFAPYVRATLFEAVRDALRDEPLLPAHRRGGGESWIPASQAYLGMPELRNLVSNGQLSELWGGGEPAKWLDGAIDSDETRALYDYLRDEHNVRNLDSDDLVQSLRSNKKLLEDQPDGWIKRLYAFLLDHGPWFASYNGYRGVPLIRLEDGTHVAPSSGSTPVAYLPTDPPSKFPNTVRAEVCSTRKAREFLESIGVQEPDRVDELIRGVLPKYCERHDISPGEYADDLREIAGAYGAASGDTRERLVEALRETPFVRTVDAGTGELSFALPGDVYARQLLDLFEGVNDVLIARPLPRGVPATEAGRLFAACGVSRTLTPVDKTPEIITERSNPTRFSHEELAVLRRKEQGNEGITWQRSSSFNDSTLRGLDGLINRLPELPSDDAERRARLLWDTLCATAQRSEAAFSAQYRWYRHKERWADVDSASVDLLNKNAWVPDGAGRLLRPSQVSLDDLGWPHNAFLESKIAFLPPIGAEVAEAFGIHDPRYQRLAAKIVRAVRKAEQEGRSLDELEAEFGVAEQTPATAAVEEGYEEYALPDLVDLSAPAVEEERIADHVGLTPAPPGRVPTPQPPREPGAPPDAPPRPEGGASAPATRARSGGAGSGKRTFRSYIEVREEAEDAPDPDGLSHEQRMALEDAAWDLIAGREPRLQPTQPGNHGYDLYETDETGEIVRWVEVKSMRGGWDAGPVGLSHRQFGLAREKREAYWLYVVEYAGDAERASLVRIRDPAGRDSDYLFDDGWRGAAGPEPPEAASP